METVTLTFDPATWFLFVTHYLVMMVICTELLLNPTMRDKVTDKHTQTQSHRVNSLCPSVISWRGHGKHFLILVGGCRVVRWCWVNLQCRGVLQLPTALAEGAGGGCLDIFTLIYPFSPLSPSLGDGPI